MPVITKRDFLVAIGATVAASGASSLLLSGAAAASTPDWAALPAGSTPSHGGKLVYAQTYPNWAIGSSDRGEHPYFWIDLLTRSVVSVRRDRR